MKVTDLAFNDGVFTLYLDEGEPVDIPKNIVEDLSFLFRMNSHREFIEDAVKSDDYTDDEIEDLSERYVDTENMISEKLKDIILTIALSEAYIEEVEEEENPFF